MAKVYAVRSSATLTFCTRPTQVLAESSPNGGFDLFRA